MSYSIHNPLSLNLGKWHCLLLNIKNMLQDITNTSFHVSETNSSISSLDLYLNFLCIWYCYPLFLDSLFFLDFCNTILSSFSISFSNYSAFFLSTFSYWSSLVAQMVKNPPAMQKTWIPSLTWEDPLEKETATHSSVLPGECHGQRSLASCSS